MPAQDHPGRQKKNNNNSNCKTGNDSHNNYYHYCYYYYYYYCYYCYEGSLRGVSAVELLRAERIPQWRKSADYRVCIGVYDVRVIVGL